MGPLREAGTQKPGMQQFAAYTPDMALCRRLVMDE